MVKLLFNTEKTSDNYSITDQESKQDKEDIFKDSFLVQKNAPSDQVEIILVRFNNKEIENRAIACVKKYTKHPYKLTIYDNYEKNEGLSTIWNRLIEKSECEYICLLNTDAFVTEGWLEGMMRGFSYDEKVVAISPSSNNAKGQISDEMRKDTFKEMDTLSGFCLLIKKNIPFSFPEEIPFYGGEHAWCIQARRRGYTLLWSQGVWVEHLGESSAKKEGNREELWSKRNEHFFRWLAKTTPVLFTTYNRVDFTKKTLPALLRSVCGEVIVVDNCSTDGTREYLKSLNSQKLKIIFHEKNTGIAGAMNTFFDLTKNEEFIAKVDNDTIVPENWIVDMLELSTEYNIDAMQAKHHILSSQFKSFDEWMSKLKKVGDHVFVSDFIGGSGVVIQRKKISESIGKSEWVLGGWDQYQKDHPELVTAFCDNVEIQLLDMHDDNSFNYNQYSNYYRKTGRVKKDVKGLEKEVAEKQAEIDVMKSSRFWKMRNKYMKIKNALFFR